MEFRDLGLKGFRVCRRLSILGLESSRSYNYPDYGGRVHLPGIRYGLAPPKPFRITPGAPIKAHHRRAEENHRNKNPSRAGGICFSRSLTLAQNGLQPAKSSIDFVLYGKGHPSFSCNCMEGHPSHTAQALNAKSKASSPKHKVLDPKPSA